MNSRTSKWKIIQTTHIQISNNIEKRLCTILSWHALAVSARANLFNVYVRCNMYVAMFIGSFNFAFICLLVFRFSSTSRTSSPPPHSSLLRCNITKENERTIMFIHNIQFWMFRSAHHRQHNSVDMKWPNKMALCVKKAFTSRRNRNSQRFNGARSFSLFFSDAMTLNFTLIDVQLAHTHTEFF